MNNLFSNAMDHISLQSSRAIPNCDNYAMGIFQNGAFHMTPLKSILQMRPQYSHLDKSDKRSKDALDNSDDGKY